jgi:hypothetical protein
MSRKVGQATPIVAARATPLGDDDEPVGLGIGETAGAAPRGRR